VPTLPEQRVALRSSAGLKGEICTRPPELQLVLTAAHAVGAGDELGRRQPKASIHQITASFLENDNIVLLSKVPDDFVDRCGFRCMFVSVRARGSSGEFRAPSNLSGATHP
jgi:hypothetical protein